MSKTIIPFDVVNPIPPSQWTFRDVRSGFFEGRYSEIKFKLNLGEARTTVILESRFNDGHGKVFFRNWWPCLTIYHLQKNRSCDFLELLIFNFGGYLTIHFWQTSQLHWWSQCLSFLILTVCHTIQRKKAKQNTALLSIVAKLHWAMAYTLF